MTVLGYIVNAVSWSIRVGCAVHFVHDHVYEHTESQGESMLPTLNFSGDYVLVNKLNRRGKNCHVGDIIVASKPTDPEQRVCKRITGMPGDIIEIDPSGGDYDKFIQVPEGHCWVTGDNLTQSLDSRSYGALPLGLIKGSIFAVTTKSLQFKWITNTLEDGHDK